MSIKLKFWDKTSDIYTPAGPVFTAEDYINQFAPWARHPQAKVVIPDSIVCGSFDNWENFKNVYKSQGAPITDDMTDDEALDVVNNFIAQPPPEPEPSAEERIAAALEFQNLLSL